MIEKIRSIAYSHAVDPSALLNALHAIQDEFGYVPKSAVPHLAGAFNLSRAEVHGVISFYHYFRSERPGRKTLYICRAESCRAMGAVQLEEHAKRRLGIDYHQTSSDGEVSLEPVYCLGNCACSPSIRINDDIHARVSPARFDELIAALEEAER